MVVPEGRCAEKANDVPIYLNNAIHSVPSQAVPIYEVDKARLSRRHQQVSWGRRLGRQQQYSSRAEVSAIRFKCRLVGGGEVVQQREAWRELYDAVSVINTSPINVKSTIAGRKIYIVIRLGCGPPATRPYARPITVRRDDERAVPLQGRGVICEQPTVTLGRKRLVVAMRSKPDVDYGVNEQQRRALKFSEPIECKSSARASKSGSPNTGRDDHGTGRPSRSRGDIECVKLLPRNSTSQGGSHRVDGVARSVDYRGADYSDITRLGASLWFRLIWSEIFGPEGRAVIGIEGIQPVMLSCYIDYVMRTVARNRKIRNVQRLSIDAAVNRPREQFPEVAHVEIGRV